MKVFNFLISLLQIELKAHIYLLIDLFVDVVLFWHQPSKAKFFSIILVTDWRKLKVKPD